MFLIVWAVFLVSCHIVFETTVMSKTNESQGRQSKVIWALPNGAKA